MRLYLHLLIECINIATQITDIEIYLQRGILGGIVVNLGTSDRALPDNQGVNLLALLANAVSRQQCSDIRNTEFAILEVSRMYHGIPVSWQIDVRLHGIYHMNGVLHFFSRVTTTVNSIPCMNDIVGVVRTLGNIRILSRYACMSQSNSVVLVNSRFTLIRNTRCVITFILSGNWSQNGIGHVTCSNLGFSSWQTRISRSNGIFYIDSDWLLTTELHIANRLDRIGARKYRGARIARYLILIGKRGGVKFCLVKRSSVI